MRYFAFNEKQRVGWFVEGLPWILFGNQIFFSFFFKSRKVMIFRWEDSLRSSVLSMLGLRAADICRNDGGLVSLSKQKKFRSDEVFALGPSQPAPGSIGPSLC